MGRTLVFDVEADGLLDTITKLHCMAAVDVSSGEEFFFGPDRIEEGLKFLEGADRLIAHNGLDYDCPAIEKLHPWWKRPPVWDTLIFVRMVWPADLLIERDMARVRQGKFPAKLVKRQSMEAWGYRLGVQKVGVEIVDWSTYTPLMGERNKSDVRVNLALWQLICKRIGWAEEPPEDGFVWSEQCFELEHQVAEILRRQEQAGIAFNKKAAIKLAQELTNLQAVHAERLKTVFGGWWAPLCDPYLGTVPLRDRKDKMGWLPDVTVPRFSPKTGKPLKPYVGPPLMQFTTDAPYTPIEWTEFNPSSRLHLGQRLMKLYGWVPNNWGGKDGRQPVVDEGTIAEIPPHILPPEVRQTVLDYFVVTKTLGQLSVGKQSWLASCSDDGRIHGRVDQLGAITARATHSRPNLAQVPSVVVKEDKDENGTVIKKRIVAGLEGGFGFECRSLFVAGTGELTGTDAAGLELRGLGHHLKPFDGGAFAARVSDPNIDIHADHARLTTLSRAATKTVSYAYIYGAGPPKIGASVGYSEAERDTLLASTALQNYLGYLKKRQREAYKAPTETEQCCIAKGLEVVHKFERGIKGIKELKKALATEAEKGWLEGLDGRKVYVRKAHAALNTRLQSDGAIICKRWMVEMAKRLPPGVQQVVWVHDELQFEHESGIGPQIAAISQQAMKETEIAYGYQCPLSTSSSTGTNWAETH